jgi:hypothetical protein
MKKTTMGTWDITIRSACFNGMIALALLSGPISLDGQQSPSKTDAALDDLHQIGMKIQDVVLKKDVAAVLRYEPAKERAEHEISLKDKTSDIYCFLIDSHSNCTQPRGGLPASVFEIISGAHQPGVAIIGGNKSQSDGIRYAVLMFYDRFAISERSIRSTRFICAPANFHKYASWSFELVDGKWESVGELFNFETDAPC